LGSENLSHFSGIEPPILGCEARSDQESYPDIKTRVTADLARVMLYDRRLRQV
jgi:hypothetical protein